MGIFKQIEKEVYIADYEELGAKACRVLVPNYSEIYEVNDLIWDNHNKALDFRTEILNLHNLEDEELESLIERLEEHGHDDQMVISELIGVAFEEATNWGQLTVGEVKLLCFLALKRFEEAKEITELFVAYNDCLPERKSFFRILNALLDITLEELEFEHYLPTMKKMYGKELIKNALGSITGEVRFFGLEDLKGSVQNIEKHQKLISSYLKLQKTKSKFHFKNPS